MSEYSIFVAVVPSVLLFISEVMPFLPTKYNGIVHMIYECIKVIPIIIGNDNNNKSS